MQRLIHTVMQLLDNQLGIVVAEPYRPYLVVLVAFIGVMLVIVLTAVYSGIFVFFERRIGGRMMSRIGPNRVGPQGLLQFVADAVKLIFKEDLIPTAADRPLFKAAPYLVVIGVFTGFAVLPLSPRFIAADLNIGVLYVLAVTSLSVVGILMSGWASNSKWALFGGMRSAAQIVSYEVPAAMALLPAVLLSGTMSTQGIIAAQGGAPWNWFIFHSPMMFVLFFVFMAAALAEGSRIPFDLPEAESELVSGYNTEYSGFRFAAYFMAEFANTWIAASLATIVFLGGWRIPGVSVATIQAASGWKMVGYEAASIAVFLMKNAVICFLIIQLRWTLPRVRVDQMMTICWKYLVPIVFVCIFLILGWMVIFSGDGELVSALQIIVQWVMFAVGSALALAYLMRIRFNLRSAKAEIYPHLIA